MRSSYYVNSFDLCFERDLCFSCFIHVHSSVYMKSHTTLEYSALKLEVPPWYPGAPQIRHYEWHCCQKCSDIARHDFASFLDASIEILDSGIVVQYPNLPRSS
jgi:hypothetical protein